MSIQLVLFLHILLSFTIIGLVLIQHGKGADAGAAFGSGASGTVFGSHGSSAFLTRLTAVVAVAFAITSLSLTLMLSKQNNNGSIIEDIQKLIPQLPSMSTNELSSQSTTVADNTSAAADADVEVSESQQKK